MGDNKNCSIDSRHFGRVLPKDIVGRVTSVHWAKPFHDARPPHPCCNLTKSSSNQGNICKSGANFTSFASAYPICQCGMIGPFTGVGWFASVYPKFAPLFRLLQLYLSWEGRGMKEDNLVFLSITSYVMIIRHRILPLFSSPQLTCPTSTEPLSVVDADRGDGSI